MSRIKEHDPEDLAKGWLRLGREFKSTPIDITGRFDDIELIPVWEAVSDLPTPSTETEAWLVNGGHVTKYWLDVWPDAKDQWYICLDNKCLGILSKEIDNYKFSCNYFEAFYTQFEGGKEDVLRYCLYVHSQGHEYR